MLCVLKVWMYMKSNFALCLPNKSVIYVMFCWGLAFVTDVLFYYFDIISASLQLELNFLIKQLYFRECNRYGSYNYYIR